MNLQWLILIMIISSVRSAIPLANPFDCGTDIEQATFSNLKAVSINDAKRYVTYAFANYCHNLEAWNCAYCPKNTRLIQTFFNSFWNTHGFLVVDDPRKEVIVSFRGSFNVQNILLDFYALPVPLSESLPGVKVHRGFLRMTNSLLDDVSTSLTENVEGNETLNDYIIVFTGHSMGGVIASLMVSILRLRNHEIVNRSAVSIYSYGANRIGNKAYADFVNAYAVNHPVGRVTGGRDFAPHLPPFKGFGYIHHGTEIYNEDNENVRICSNEFYEDPTCSNRNGPFYNPIDHLRKYWLSSTLCFLEDPIAFLLQLVPRTNTDA